ncbi:hypothetical protein ABVT39_026731 [Epinephelus coioides]
MENCSAGPVGAGETNPRKAAKPSVSETLAVVAGEEKGKMVNAGNARQDKMADKTPAEAGEAVRSAAAREEATRSLVASEEVEGETMVSMLELLRAVDNTCGRVLGCRAKGHNKWELTMNNPKDEMVYRSGPEDEEATIGQAPGDGAVLRGEGPADSQLIVEEEEEDPGDDFSGVPAVFRRPERAVIRSSIPTPRARGAESQRDRSRSFQNSTEATDAAT